eukprot:m.348954 g.348954  ORF g.348954 m.348954 type:complete len:107 (+) comp20683_c0_seq14:1379-1699(+)
MRPPCNPLTEWQSTPPVPRLSDRNCSELTNCTERVFTSATATTDRVCSAYIIVHVNQREVFLSEVIGGSIIACSILTIVTLNLLYGIQATVHAFCVSASTSTSMLS